MDRGLVTAVAVLIAALGLLLVAMQAPGASWRTNLAPTA